MKFGNGYSLLGNKTIATYNYNMFPLQLKIKLYYFIMSEQSLGMNYYYLIYTAFEYNCMEK